MILTKQLQSHPLSHFLNRQLINQKRMIPLLQYQSYSSQINIKTDQNKHTCNDPSHNHNINSTQSQTLQSKNSQQNNQQQQPIDSSKHSRLAQLRQETQLQNKSPLIKDFKFFIMKAKVQQTYRESLKEAQTIEDSDLRSGMYEMMRDEFDVFRRQRNQKLDSERIDYYLALIRKKLTIIEEIKKRTFV